jgi:ubiquinone/menaquinone biosynthesis C-methylase UbiE
VNRLLVYFLNFFFDFLYHQGSWSYDLVATSVSLGRWQDWIASVLPDITTECVLELGHGPGHLQIALNKEGKKVIGLDESMQMGRMASSNLHREGFTPRLVNGLAQWLPFPGSNFQQVVATFPTQYILEPETLAEIYRILLPGGSLIVLPVAWITGSAWYDRFAAGLFRITGQAPEWDERFFMPFKEAGFQVRLEYQSVKASKILIILAVKPENM